jgi:hypothetical protein
VTIQCSFSHCRYAGSEKGLRPSAPAPVLVAEAAFTVPAAAGAPAMNEYRRGTRTSC